MSQYCTINTGVLIGNKNSNVNRATIGNNVILCPGSKVIGAVSVGNNTIIAPNAVVVKDVPDNWIVGGVPAKLIKINNV